MSSYGSSASDSYVSQRYTNNNVNCLTTGVWIRVLLFVHYLISVEVSLASELTLMLPTVSFVCSSLSDGYINMNLHLAYCLTLASPHWINSL